MRSTPQPASGDLDSPEQIAEMVRRFYADVAQDGLDLADDVARVHSHQLLGHAVSVGSSAPT